MDDTTHDRIDRQGRLGQLPRCLPHRIEVALVQAELRLPASSAQASAAASDLSQMGVVVAPGSITETRIPQARSSNRMALFTASKACLEAA